MFIELKEVYSFCLDAADAYVEAFNHTIETPSALLSDPMICDESAVPQERKACGNSLKDV
jgi:hypothetical protein